MITLKGFTKYDVKRKKEKYKWKMRDKEFIRVSSNKNLKKSIFTKKDY